MANSVTLHPIINLKDVAWGWTLLSGELYWNYVKISVADHDHYRELRTTLPFAQAYKLITICCPEVLIQVNESVHTWLNEKFQYTIP